MNNANEKWLALPSDLRGKLIKNVWCTKCSDVVKITNYIIYDHPLGISLEGKCETCGLGVSRVIELEN
ncbi:hypothetical protein [Bacillus alkalicellulosilyticus]|uniref:hypothetical protein n=1 Tax=Alkalihalobacterium alkalicellulosilyticum TaxID=1912214 RepID=UPI000998BDC4|nr:hypothetical protein [Bacillus alkalicellulosilyticus]